MSNKVRIEDLLERAVSLDASDLHLQVGSVPVFRVSKDLVGEPSFGRLSEEDLESMVYSILDEDQKKNLLDEGEVNFGFEFGDSRRFRVNVFHERNRLAAALRLIGQNIPTIEELGMPRILNDLVKHNQGLVLVTGPTGSGKSTTLASMVSKINAEESKRIITLENPIEYVYRSKRSLIAQREIGQDTKSFLTGIKAALREDPDVMLVGEISDLETISAAVTAAETGHLVLATIHTNSAASSINRLIDVFSAAQQSQIRHQLSYSLKSVVSQRLIRAANGGLRPATEVMLSNDAIANTIRENKIHQIESLLQTGLAEGMQTLNQDLSNQVKLGLISYDVALATSLDTKDLNRNLQS